MNKKPICIVLSAVFTLAMLSACAGEEEVPVSSSQVVPQLSQLEMDIAQYEDLMVTEPSAENYATLAGYYQQAGEIKKQRNILELSYRTMGDVAALEALQAIVVNGEEESMDVLEKLQLLEQNMSVAENRAEALAQLLSPDWHSVVMPTLQTGVRSYYWHNSESQNTVLVQVGYNETGEAISRVWHTAGETLTYLYQGGEEAVLVETALQNGWYNGPVSAWVVEGDTGTVYHEEGTFTNGFLTGDYTANSASVGDAVDLYTLFSTRDTFEMEAFTGNFDETGHTTVEQVEGENAFIVYAYDENGVQYLQRNIPPNASAEEVEEDTSDVSDVTSSTDESTSDISDVAAAASEVTPSLAPTVDSNVFDGNFYHMPAIVVYTAYTPVAEAAPSGVVNVDLSTVQIRVRDSEIEWFDGTMWHSAGHVQDYVAQDPFYIAPTEQEGQASENVSEEATEEDTDNADEAGEVFHLRQRSEIVQQQTTQTTTTTTAPTTTTPTTQAPATTTPAPTPAPEPTPEPAPTPAPETGDGGDIAWTPDLL